MLKNLSIMLLSVTLKTTVLCLKLCSKSSTMLGWSWLYLMPLSIPAVKNNYLHNWEKRRFIASFSDSYFLISYRAEAWHYRIFPDFLKSPVSKWRIVGVKTRTKEFFFEEILINIPSDNLSKLSKERMPYFCHALKLNWRSRHSASARAIVRWTGRSNQTWL